MKCPNCESECLENALRCGVCGQALINNQSKQYPKNNIEWDKGRRFSYSSTFFWGAKSIGRIMGIAAIIGVIYFYYRIPTFKDDGILMIVPYIEITGSIIFGILGLILELASEGFLSIVETENNTRIACNILQKIYLNQEVNTNKTKSSTKEQSG